MYKYKILVVDDEPNIVRIMKFQLNNEGYDIVTALNGEEALEVARRERPQLIVADVMMPVLNGYEFCKQLKELPEHRHIPFIFLTAKTGDENKIYGYAIGAVKYLNKPVNKDEFIKAINLRLKHAEEAKRLFAQKARKFSGDLAVISVFSLLDMFSIGGWYGHILMFTPDGKSGRIELKEGIITRCFINNRDDSANLLNILSWNEGSFVAEHV